MSQTMVTKIQDIFTHDPSKMKLPNNGVAEVEQEDTLRFELQTFVCEGQYAKGLERILNSYITRWNEPEQPAAWVSGFYGSGKSHLVKMLRYLWIDHILADGASSRGITKLSPEVKDLFGELTTLGKRAGGVHAAAGKLEQAVPVRRGLLSILFRSLGLPEEYPLARFVMWMKSNNFFDKVKNVVEAAGKSLDREIRNMYVSPVLSQALLEVPNFAKDASEVKMLLKEQFPRVDGDITDQQMIDTISDLLEINSKLPCTLIVLDELQQYIGDSAERAYNVQLVTQACSKRFGGRLLFVATGQSALSGTPSLQRIQARFPVQVELTDTDVETVTRRLILAKAPTATTQVEHMLKTCSGEIDRHLPGTKIAPRNEDSTILTADYPILPTRRRFWELVLRAVDKAGTVGQLRTQLRIVFEAVRSVADRTLGTVVPADFIYDQIYPNMLQSGVLLKDVNETILRQKDGTDEGNKKYRLAALIFLINQLASEMGIRTNSETLADLLVEDLKIGSSTLRKEIPSILDKMVEKGDLMQIDNEFHIQTREGAKWEGDYRTHLSRLGTDDTRIAEERCALLNAKCTETLKNLKLFQGKSKVPREVEILYSQNKPKNYGESIPLWIRDGWAEKESSVRSDAHQAGTDSPMIFIFLPRLNADQLKGNIAGWIAARETLALHGNITTPEGQEARKAMETRERQFEMQIKQLMGEIFDQSIILQGGGNEITGKNLREAVEEAAHNALMRLYKNFSIADDSSWPKVIERVRKGDGTPLSAVGFNGETKDHEVCKQILTFIASGKKGSEIRIHFRSPAYGWPQDAVDGALMALAAAGIITAHHGGQQLIAKGLDQAKIGVTEFKPVSVQITPTHRIALRKVLQEAGITCKVNEELSVLPKFLEFLTALRNDAGGEAPLPERPDGSHIQKLLELSGNEQAFEIYNLRVQLMGEMNEWNKRADEIRKRKPRWDRVMKLLEHAKSIAQEGSIKPQLDAIKLNGCLLENPDPLSPLMDMLTDNLRMALQQTYVKYTQSFNRLKQGLELEQAWKKLPPNEQIEIYGALNLVEVSLPPVGTEVELLDALEDRSFGDWDNLADALPQRFNRALLEAVKKTTPQAVQVSFPKRTLNSESEVEKYLAEVKSIIMKHIAAGNPVVM